MKDLKKVRTKKILIFEIIVSIIAILLVVLAFVLPTTLKLKDSVEINIFFGANILAFLLGGIGLKVDKKIKKFRCLNCGCCFELDDTMVNHRGGWNIRHYSHGGRLTFKCPACGTGTISHQTIE